MKINIFILLILVTSISCSSLAKITITPIGATIGEKQEKLFKAEGFDKKGKKVKINPTWTVDTGGDDIGALTQQSNTEAIFKSTDFGVAVITVQEKEIKASAKLFIAKKKVPHMPQK
jgi:hypothetical protein